MRNQRLAALLSAFALAGVPAIAAAAPDDQNAPDDFDGPDADELDADPGDPGGPTDRMLPAPRSSMTARPRLGVALIEVSPSLRQQMGGDADRGVLVNDVLDGSPAERAGVRVGDLILEVDGVPAMTSKAVRSVMDARRHRDTVRVAVMRDGKRIDLHATLGADASASATEPDAPAAPPPVRNEWFPAPQRRSNDWFSGPRAFQWHWSSNDAALRRELDQARQRIDALEQRLQRLERKI
ncbi:MAG: PDZ domain-containing protein [Kofleriaceae bacterium]